MISAAKLDSGLYVVTAPMIIEHHPYQINSHHVNQFTNFPFPLWHYRQAICLMTDCLLYINCFLLLLVRIIRSFVTLVIMQNKRNCLFLLVLLNLNIFFILFIWIFGDQSQSYQCLTISIFCQ